VPKKTADKQNPLATLIKILANALLEDEPGINITAYNALLILAELADPNLPAEIQKKVMVQDDRHRYEN